MNNVDKFINELVKRGKSNCTVSSYTTDVKQFKQWLCDTLGIDNDSLTRAYIEQYVQYMHITQKRKSNTINKKVKSIVKYINFLNNINVCNTIIDINEIKLVRVEKTKVRIIAKQDLAKLEKTIYDSKNKKDIVIYELLVNTAISCSELINIDEVDIHLTDNNDKNNFSYVDIKTNKLIKNRRIPLNDDVVTAITDYLDVRPSSKDNRLLQGQKGPIKGGAINKLLVSYSKQSNIELVTPNMLRHASLKAMVMNGIDCATIARIAGHSSIESIYKYFLISNIQDEID